MSTHAGALLRTCRHANVSPHSKHSPTSLTMQPLAAAPPGPRPPQAHTHTYACLHSQVHLDMDDSGIQPGAHVMPHNIEYSGMPRPSRAPRARVHHMHWHSPTRCAGARARAVQVRKLRQLFDEIDESGDGVVGRGELRRYAAALQRRRPDLPLYAEADSVFSSLDRDRSGKLSFAEVRCARCACCACCVCCRAHAPDHVKYNKNRMRVAAFQL